MPDDTDSISEFANVRIGNLDKNSREIVDVYANQEGRYAVYQTDKRVIVLYAEDPLVQRAQRKHTATIAALRSEIDGALAEWRSKGEKGRWFRTLSRLPHSARQFDIRVASALIETLEGDVDAGTTILGQVKTEIANERASRARLSYLLWTLAMAGLFLLACMLAYNAVEGAFAGRTRDAATRIVQAMMTGVLGATYSIALGIERRQIRNDQRRLDHITDATVRIMIGVLAAFILQAFLLSGVVQINFGTTGTIAGQAGGNDGVHLTYWPVALIAGFLAGFAERLVPDLLNSYSVKEREPDAVAKPSPLPATAGRKPDAATVGGEPDPETPVEPNEDEAIDGCDVKLDDEANATPDEDLPAASGGVARE